jgi:uncharacterized protein (TIGR03435 family)
MEYSDAVIPVCHPRDVPVFTRSKIASKSIRAGPPGKYRATITRIIVDLAGTLASRQQAYGLSKGLAVLVLHARSVELPALGCKKPSGSDLACVLYLDLASELDRRQTAMRMSAVIMTYLLVTGSAAQVLRTQSPAFEIASVKVNHTGEHPRTYPQLRNGTFTAEIASSKTLIVIAYGLIELRIKGPEWLDTEKYDITAKAPEGVPDSQSMPLLQSLLKDRFHPESHFETQEMPAYDMVVSKGGSKLKPFDPDHPPEVPRGYAQTVMVGLGSTGELADMLARGAGRPVVDKTGLEGRFGWVLTYTPFSANADAASSTAPDIFAAIEQQLGIKLEPKRESLQILIIDPADRIPTGN